MLFADSVFGVGHALPRGAVLSLRTWCASSGVSVGLGVSVSERYGVAPECRDGRAVEWRGVGRGRGEQSWPVVCSGSRRTSDPARRSSG